MPTSYLGMSEIDIHFWQLVVSGVGFILTVLTLSFGVYQYYRGEKWKRREFVAQEIKTSEADPRVATGLLLLDWGVRRVNLSRDGQSSYVVVNRDLQWRALLPHPIKPQFPAARATIEAIDPNRDKQSASMRESAERIGTERVVDVRSHNTVGVSPIRAEAASPARTPEESGISRTSLWDLVRFTPEEACIRDIYDALLGFWERLATFIDADLVPIDDLSPYLQYWARALRVTNKEDVEWKAVLLAYIHFYGFSGVQRMFSKLGCDIGVRGPIFQELIRRIETEGLADALQSVLTVADVVQRPGARMPGRRDDH